MKNTQFYIFTGIIFILFKFGFTFSDNDDLQFLLNPTNKLVEIFTGSQSVYISEKGYCHETLNIVINKSCSGFNFWLISFMAFAYLTVTRSVNSMQKSISIPAALIFAYFFSIFTNSSRIFASIIVQNATAKIVMQQQLLHETIGIITNLSFLVLTYYLIDKLLTHLKNNAQLS